jgi:hypothetical protein
VNTGVPNALNITASGGSGAINGWFLAATIFFNVTVAAANLVVQVAMPAIMTNVRKRQFVYF